MMKIIQSMWFLKLRNCKHQPYRSYSIKYITLLVSNVNQYEQSQYNEKLNDTSKEKEKGKLAKTNYTQMHEA